MEEGYGKWGWGQIGAVLPCSGFSVTFCQFASCLPLSAVHQWEKDREMLNAKRCCSHWDEMRCALRGAQHCCQGKSSS